MDDQVSMTFRLYDAQTGGASTYTEVEGAVDVSGGVFDATLGPFPDGFFVAHPAPWLETQVGTVVLPREPLRAVPLSLLSARADVATVAEGLACTGCVGDAALSVNYAASASKGGAATGLDCAGCVEGTALATAAIGPGHIQDGAVGASKVAFAYAAGDGQKRATDVACVGCIGSLDLAQGLALAGDVSVSGSLHACTAGASGCSLRAGDAALRDSGDGWLVTEVGAGLRVRSVGDTAWRPMAFGGGTSNGDLAIVGKATITGSVGVGTASPTAPLDVRGAVVATGALQVGWSAAGSSGVYPDAVMYLRDDGWWMGVVAGAQTGWADTHSLVVRTPGAGYPFAITSGASSVPHLLVDPSGKVGIGTATPAVLRCTPRRHHRCTQNVVTCLCRFASRRSSVDRRRRVKACGSPVVASLWSGAAVRGGAERRRRSVRRSATGEGAATAAAHVASLRKGRNHLE